MPTCVYCEDCRTFHCEDEPCGGPVAPRSIEYMLLNDGTTIEDVRFKVRLAASPHGRVVAKLELEDQDAFADRVRDALNARPQG